MSRLGAAGLLGVLLTATACGVPTGDDPSTIAPSDVPYGLAAPAPRATAEQTPVPREEAGWAYLVGADGALVPLARDSGAGSPEQRLGMLLAALADGPTDEERARRLSTALPAGVTLSVGGIDGATATIDLSAAAPLPSGVASRQAVAQIVLTATSLPGVEAVLLTSEGEPVEAPLPSGALTDEPLLPADYAVFLSPPPATGPAAPATPRPSTTEPQASPTAPRPFVADTRPDTAVPSAGAAVTVTDVRVGQHEGFDRVVFVVDGAGLPGWDVRYVPEARSAGSGLPVEVAGEAVLRVVLTGVGLPGDTGVAPYSGPDPLGLGGPAVDEVSVDSVFEGELVAFLGTAAERPFRVYRLQDPSRVVVEVLHQG
ncbi:AMIN-like domain-containing (lipo)protein [Blastococcus xanthinilyticus]|uniref:Sporulation and spore germination protein n=1 Tax=Blastococcus xanthinilyticus TaxID=1564164 RepID=A0A5S5CK22_9ACTN|nr:GerMN domain-containing protein [Blastococcus xanthinilyticus]TYP80648.1 sporulation and spore germination protein [Blastococcus xanthinilyticus]